MDILIHLLIVAVVFGLVFYVLQLLPLAEPWGRLVRVIVGIIAVLYVLSLLFGLLPYAHGPLRL